MCFMLPKIRQVSNAYVMFQIHTNAHSCINIYVREATSYIAYINVVSSFKSSTRLESIYKCYKYEVKSA